MSEIFFDKGTILDDGEKKYRNVSYVKNLSRATLLKYKIEATEQYRPDKIAHDIYGDAELFWVLDLVNNFTHEFKEYKQGATILYPPEEILIQHNII